MHRRIAILVVGIVVSGCVPTYSLISASSHAVAKSDLTVTTGTSWNKTPKLAGQIAQEETWTLNGPNLDAVRFVAGVKEGEAIVKQKAKDDRQVPNFSSSMTPPELASMVESYYRIELGAADYTTLAIAPTEFVGQTGMQIDYGYTGQDDVKRRGRTVLAVVGGELYMMSLLGAELHYYDAALSEFDAMVRSARVAE